MPAWIITLLIKYGVPLAISILQKTGVINAAEAWGVKAGTHVLTAVENTKVEYTYPPDKNTGIVTGNR